MPHSGKLAFDSSRRTRFWNSRIWDLKSDFCHKTGDGGRRDRSRWRGVLRPRVLDHPLPLMCSLGGARGPHRLAPVSKARPYEGERLSTPGAVASRMLPSEHGDIGTSDWIHPRAVRYHSTDGPRHHAHSLLRGPQGGRCTWKSDCRGPTYDRGSVSPLSGSKRPLRRSARGPSAAGRARGLHLPLSRGDGRPTGPALSLATTTPWWRSGLRQHSPQDVVQPIQDPGTMCFFFFFGSTGALHSIACAPLTTRRGLGG